MKPKDEKKIANNGTGAAAIENVYDHLHMHHTPGNTKQNDELTLPEKLLHLEKSPVNKPGRSMLQSPSNIHTSVDPNIC